jgi:hypothetical protein
MVAMSDLEVQVATSTHFGHGRHLQMARKMVFMATFSSNRFTHHGRHSDQIATKAPHQRIKRYQYMSKSEYIYERLFIFKGSKIREKIQRTI